MICGSCHGTGHLLRRWRKGPKRVCGGCDGRGWIIVRQAKLAKLAKKVITAPTGVSAYTPKKFTGTQ